MPERYFDFDPVEVLIDMLDYGKTHVEISSEDARRFIQERRRRRLNQVAISQALEDFADYCAKYTQWQPCIHRGIVGEAGERLVSKLTLHYHD